MVSRGIQVNKRTHAGKRAHAEHGKECRTRPNPPPSVTCQHQEDAQQMERGGGVGGASQSANILP